MMCCFADDFNWSHEAIVALLDEYKQHGHLITPKKQTKQLWTIICSQLVEKGHNITASQCKRKLAGLKSTYENVKSRSAQSNNTNQTWQYFDVSESSLCDMHLYFFFFTKAYMLHYVICFFILQINISSGIL